MDYLFKKGGSGANATKLSSSALELIHLPSLMFEGEDRSATALPTNNRLRPTVIKLFTAAIYKWL
jgi:hypothetical protein